MPTSDNSIRPLLSSSAVTGRTHRIWRQNRHDVALTGSDPARGCWWGAVLDGCGSKTATAAGPLPAHNEVGAKLSGQFVNAWWQRTLGREERQPLATLLPLLYRDYLAFLEQSLQLFPWPDTATRTTFCASHLLATLVGFVVTPDAAAFYWRGDGYLCCDGNVVTLEADNRPAYPAYDLLAPPAAESGFQIRFLDRPALSWLAVASDGWRPDLLAQLAQPRASLALQRWLNRRAGERGNFDDDGAVALLYLKDAGVAGSAEQKGNAR